MEARVAELSIIPVNTAEDLDRFVELPWSIYTPDSLWVPNLKKQSYEEGEAIGEARGEARGAEKLARLVVELKKRGRVEDIAKVTDESERERLYREFNI